MNEPRPHVTSENSKNRNGASEWLLAKIPQQKGSTSLSLLKHVRAHEPEAWQTLLEIYAPLVCFWCRTNGLPEQEIDDVMQEVFQAVSKSIDRFRRDRAGDSFRGWLRTITHNKVQDFFRRSNKEPKPCGGSEAKMRFAQLEYSETRIGTDEDQVTRSVVHRALEVIRRDFAVNTWTAFWRVVVDDQPAKDVAQELAMTPGAVRVAKSRVLHRLRVVMGERIDDTAWRAHQ